MLKLIWMAIPIWGKIGILAAVIGAIFLLVRWHDNAIRADERDKNMTEFGQDLAKKMEAEQKEKLEAIAVKESALDVKSKILDDALAQNAASRTMNLARWEQVLTNAQTTWEANRASIYNVPVSQLNDTVRAQSNKLAAAKAAPGK